MFLMIVIAVHFGSADLVQVLDNYPTWAKCEQRIPAVRQRWHLPPRVVAMCIPTNRNIH